MKMQAGVALEDKPPLGCAHSHARVPAALLQNQLPTNTPRKAADDSEPLTPMWENHDGPPGSWLLAPAWTYPDSWDHLGSKEVDRSVTLPINTS